MGGKSPKLHHPSLRRFHLKSEFAQSLAQFCAKSFRSCLILKADYEVIRVADETGKAGEALAVNLLKPEIKDVVKIYVCQ